MALTTGNPVLASDMNSLKSRYNSEMARRKYTGSLASYNNSFSPAVAAGVICYKDHQNKVVAGMRALNATSMPALANSGDTIKELNTLSNRLTNNTKTALTASTSDCTSACSGLCHTACSGACKGGCSSCQGCTNSCTSCTSCSGSCDGCQGCWSACVTTCNYTCPSSCSYGGCWVGAVGGSK